jgi:Hint module
MPKGVLRPSRLFTFLDVNGKDLACPTKAVPMALDLCVNECRNYLGSDQVDCVKAVETYYAATPSCFSADTWTYVVGKGKVIMSNLSIGDVVLDHNLAYTTVTNWLHHDPDLSSKFIKISLHGFDSLTVSADHLLYDPSKQDFVLAAEASSLQAMSFDATFCDLPLSAKARFEVVTSKGVFAPLTESGTILVQNIVASCYASPERLRSVLSHRSANLAMWPVRRGYVPFDFHIIEEYIEMLCELGELAE